jgi:hypothetical protein
MDGRVRGRVSWWCLFSWMGWRRSSQIPGPAHEGMQRGERDYLCVALARGICLWGGIMILNSKSRRGGKREEWFLLMDQRLLVRVWSFVDPEKRSDVGLFIESGWERLIFPRVWASLFFFFLPFGQSDGATDRTTTQNNRGEKMEGRKGGGRRAMRLWWR